MYKCECGNDERFFVRQDLVVCKFCGGKAHEDSEGWTHIDEQRGGSYVDEKADIGRSDEDNYYGSGESLWISGVELRFNRGVLERVPRREVY